MFLLRLCYPGQSDDLLPAIRRRAREVILRRDEATKRRTGSNLEDRGRIISLMYRQMAAGLSQHKAAESVAKRLSV